MAEEDYGANLETPELAASRIRQHLRDADAKRATDAKAASIHDARATGLIDKLSRRLLGKAEGYAARAFGRAFELHEEALVEIFIHLDRALRNYETRKGLEERFDATFHSIVVDAIRHVARTNRGMSGDTVDGMSIVSSDNVEDDDEGLPSDSFQDSGALQAIFAAVDTAAFDEIAMRMPVRQLEVLRLRAEGWEFKEIATKLKINRDTASADYNRGLAFIKNHLTRNS
jgi:RNA polymerase sigma factor (sigma-70 family)